MFMAKKYSKDKPERNGKYDKKKGSKGTSYSKNDRKGFGDDVNSCDNIPDRVRDRNSKSKVMNAHTSAPNDIRWYSQNEQLLRDVASFAYGYPLGAKFTTHNLANDAWAEISNPSQGPNNTALPGVLSVRVILGIGYSDNPNSPVNIAARNLYTFIRAANSGAKNYDANDLIQYLVALDSAYAFLAWMKRLYGLMSVSNVENRYYPWAVVTAAGGVYSDLKNHMADFRAYINMFAVRLASMCIPAHMSFMARHEWMFSGIYLDTPEPHSQSYCFTPEGFHFFDLDKDGAGKCAFHSFDAFGMDGTYDAITKYGNAMLQPILAGYGEEDFNLISGDILKAYGESGVHRATMIEDTYSVIPTFDLTALGQIQNCKTMPIPVGTSELDSKLDILQNATKNYLIWEPRVGIAYLPKELNTGSAASNLYRGSYMINTYSPQPGPADSMEYTRLANMVNDDGYITTAGSEIVTRFYIFYFMNTSHGWDLVQSSPCRNDITFKSIKIDHTVPDDPIPWADSIMDAGAVATAFEKLAQLSNFRYHPYVSSILTQRSGPLQTIGYWDTVNGAYWSNIIGDVNAFTLVDENNLKLLTEVALLRPTSR